MAKCSVQATLFGTIVHEAEGCIYTNSNSLLSDFIKETGVPKDKESDYLRRAGMHP